MDKRYAAFIRLAAASKNLLESLNFGRYFVVSGDGSERYDHAVNDFDELEGALYEAQDFLNKEVGK